MIKKINAKTLLEGGRGVSTKPTTKRPGMMEVIALANLVIGSYNDGVVRILKDRLKGETTPLHGRASVDEVIDRASSIISHAVFGKNDISIFQSGLSEQIQEAIKATINKFHTKGDN